MVVGLWLVLLMLAGLSAGSISGLYAYRKMVRELEFGIEGAPHSSELMAAVGLLIKPLSMDFPEEASAEDQQRFAERQRDELQETLAITRARIAAFRRKLQEMPLSAGQSAQRELVRQSLFAEIEKQLGYLEEATPALANVGQRTQQIEYLTQITAGLMELVEQLPDPSNDLLVNLDQARSNYRWYLGLVGATVVATIAMLLNLVRCAQRWVIHPVRELHQGTRRVAAGDFDYRIHMSTDDEIAELAADFNQMTERFQAITADLDRQVKERVQQLIRSERLAGLGFLSAGVAHEINNPLSAIAMAAESLEYRVSEWLPSDDGAAEVRDYLQMIQSEAHRCRQITEKLLDFARGQDGERNLYDVTAIVREVVAMTQHLGRFRDRTIEVDRTSPCYAWVNGPEIKQVVLNLVANALESTGEDGRLQISIVDRPDQVVLSFRDNGCGMGRDVIEHLFEPFYTTKEVGKGTGLGLSISQRIVRDHGGALDAESDGPGKGSTFHLRLPAKAPTLRAA